MLQDVKKNLPQKRKVYKAIIKHSVSREISQDVANNDYCMYVNIFHNY